jgi:formylglycine-generating enzyme required for sulfatase activity
MRSGRRVRSGAQALVVTFVCLTAIHYSSTLTQRGQVAWECRGSDRPDRPQHSARPCPRPKRDGVDSRPIYRVYVDGYFVDKTDVTDAQFAEFVKATGYVTIAEKTPTAEDFPGAPPENLYAGRVVFSLPNHTVDLNNHCRHAQKTARAPQTPLKLRGFPFGDPHSFGVNMR